MRAYGMGDACMMLGIVAPQCVCLLPCHCSLLSSVVQCSCDAEHKPLKEEMGALPGAGHLRVPRKGDKRVCHTATPQPAAGVINAAAKKAAAGGVEWVTRPIAAASGGVRRESSAPALV
ncbi:hypothetical protein PVAP13_5NG066581 [Panicum virgatum]|uniref:Uncharacterized protein n=1 Tax=Panicum virgatum TaxID=38727 RepID=A0A8T0RQ59_PANVG|nr:hypothetical protein PVAP13_5NG066581 [Panicum virgatum]